MIPTAKAALGARLPTPDDHALAYGIGLNYAHAMFDAHGG